MEKLSNIELFKLTNNIITSMELKKIKVGNVNISVYSKFFIRIEMFTENQKSYSMKVRISDEYISISLDDDDKDKNVMTDIIDLSEKILDNESNILNFLFENIEKYEKTI